MTEIEAKTTTDIETQSPENEARAERVSVIDYKMVTFSLAGKDYAIDIMQVKEIAKAGRFTYVPNTSPFVLGVYNLRGDIIPIIDLRIFFNIPTRMRDTDALESLIIIAVNEQTFGIVVDAIDKVVGISKNSIQPPHPIFGDINIKYIHGVVENQGRLYILLDAERIFGNGSKTERSGAAADVETSPVPEVAKAPVQTGDDLDISFIKDGLGALGKFYVTAVNEQWVVSRYRSWRDQRSANDIQLKSEEDARAYLEPFPSKCSGSFWSDEYAAEILAILPQNQAKQINVWNVGCGKGYEAYSLAILLKDKYPNARIRIYANDSDLLAISNAPMLAVPEAEIFFPVSAVSRTGGRRGLDVLARHKGHDPFRVSRLLEPECRAEHGYHRIARRAFVPEPETAILPYFGLYREAQG